MRYLTFASIFTFASLTLAFIAVIFAVQQYVAYASLCWIIAVLLDWLDGRIARKLGSANDFGMYLDSLADVGAFGFAPAISAVLLADMNWYVVASAIVFLIAGTFRLARFQSEKVEGGFSGMPITVNGLAFPLVLIVSGPTHYVPVFCAFLLISGALMVATFRVSKI